MSRGPGRVQKLIDGLIASDPHGAWSVTQLCKHIYPDAPIEKKHRVAVTRALRKMVLPATWDVQKLYYNHGFLRSSCQHAERRLSRGDRQHLQALDQRRCGQLPEHVHPLAPGLGVGRVLARMGLGSGEQPAAQHRDRSGEIVDAVAVRCGIREPDADTNIVRASAEFEGQPEGARPVGNRRVSSPL